MGVMRYIRWDAMMTIYINIYDYNALKPNYITLKSFTLSAFYIYNLKKLLTLPFSFIINYGIQGYLYYDIIRMVIEEESGCSLDWKKSILTYGILWPISYCFMVALSIRRAYVRSM